jgi:hypothetical protein
MQRCWQVDLDRQRLVEMGRSHHRRSRRLSLEVPMDAHREELAAVRDQRQVERLEEVMQDRLKEKRWWVVMRVLLVLMWLVGALGQ